MTDPERKPFAAHSIAERAGIVALAAVLLLAVAVVLTVLAGLSVRLIEWVWV